jgi:TonB family protein
VPNEYRCSPGSSIPFAEYGMNAMTFQRSLYVSIFVHILFFGSAIAIAGYGGALLRSPQDHIVVSLIDSGSGSDGGGSRSVRLHQPKDTSKPVEALPPQSMVIQTPVEASRDERSDQTTKDTAAINAAGIQPQEVFSASGAGQRSGIGVISVEQWAAIESQIERSKNYPRMARERGIQGVVRVRFKLKPSGDVDQVEIAKSSGYDVLDAASIKTVYRASPMPYVNGWMEVPMTYVLK